MALALLLCIGCGDGAGGTTEVTSPVSGILRHFSASPSGEIQTITLETDAGSVVKFAVELDPPGAVNAQHLQLHIARKLPVSVSFAGEGDRRVAYQINDALP